MRTQAIVNFFAPIIEGARGFLFPAPATAEERTRFKENAAGFALVFAFVLVALW